MKKLIVTMGLTLISSNALAEKPMNDMSLKLSANTVPCYGSVAGMCELDGKLVTHEQLVSNVSGEPSFVTSIHYFSNRDDKIILEYTTLEIDYMQRMAGDIGTTSTSLKYIWPSDLSDYLEQQKLVVKKDCPKLDGCQPLLEFIDKLHR
ncbi:hypothetical protein [Vibrio coralliilyticus]|uniref:DUF3757 domain-containing protein n=1 Tax=Vibrio coralliilyticus TaxID=190893 RepID=A0AAP7DG29_9VIBR|nr:hypothetical protein [Vibrio coralliilyticus]NOI32040.1 hypothetical protein [Vibrio coralliilyticus]NOJ25240.1 hypothetical protein [Vibrio coralliilyticus]